VTLDVARCCALSCLVGSSELGIQYSSTLPVFGSTLLRGIGGSGIVAKDAQLRANHVDDSINNTRHKAAETHNSEMKG
jgi:hypothetical protein